MSNSITARQGDVLVIPTPWPNGLKPAASTTGERIVLAYGEATGHHHSFPSRLAVLGELNGRRFVAVTPSGGEADGERMRALNFNAAIADLWTPETVAARDVGEIKADTAEIVAHAEACGFAALQHLGSDGVQADHLPIVFPPGFTGEVKVPREYVRGELPRGVED